jgi:hypothetical protein
VNPINGSLSMRGMAEQAIPPTVRRLLLLAMDFLHQIIKPWGAKQHHPYQQQAGNRDGANLQNGDEYQDKQTKKTHTFIFTVIDVNLP